MEKQLYCGRCHKKVAINDLRYVQTPQDRLLLVCSSCRAHVRQVQKERPKQW